MSIVLDPNRDQLLSIELHYIEMKKKRGNLIFYFIHSAEEMEEWKTKGYIPIGDIKQGQQTDKVIQKIQTFWKAIRWKEQNIIFSRSIRPSQRPDGTVMDTIDPLKYRDLKLKTCLKKWDVKDEKGNEVPVNDDVVDSLDPTVAHELLTAFEKVTEPSDDDLKVSVG